MFTLLLNSDLNKKILVHFPIDTAIQTLPDPSTNAVGSLFVYNGSLFLRYLIPPNSYREIVLTDTGISINKIIDKVTVSTKEIIRF